MGIADNTPQKGYCLYAHINKKSGKIYMGISKDVKKRWIGKIHAYKHSTYFQNALKKYGWNGFDHIVLWDNMTLEEACKQEQNFIYLFKFIGISYNITDGGEGHEGVKLTEKQKQRLREVHLGKVFSEEHRRKLSEAQKKHSIRRKKVYMFDASTGALIKEYNSVAEASLDTKIRDSRISEAARGISYTAGGYLWSYTPNIDKSILKRRVVKPTRRKKIYCYDLKGRFIKEYSSACDAIADVGGCITSIYTCCSRKNLTSGGFIWRYELCEIEPEILNKIKDIRHETD